MRLNKKFVIISASDSRYGDFLINHWLKSLIVNVDKKLTDIVILNYGLTKKQKKSLISKKIIIFNCKKDGHVVNIRYRDMLNFLNKNKYEQVLSCDSGDIIFQKDITPIFYSHKNEFRGVLEDLDTNFADYILENKPFSEKVEKEIVRVLNNKKTINGGLVVAPYEKFKRLCLNMNNFIKDKSEYGPDQLVLNYTLYTSGFFPLKNTYNYVINSNLGFIIKEGTFLDKNLDIISVVHNTGGNNLFRSIKNFGYGRKYNHLNKITFFLVRSFMRIKIFTFFKLFTRMKRYLHLNLNQFFNNL